MLLLARTGPPAAADHVCTESVWLMPSHQTAVLPRRGNGLFSRLLDEDDAAAFVVRSYVLNWALGVSRLYWYAWDNQFMGLVEPDGRTFKVAGRAWETAQRWIGGAEIRGCEATPDQTWVCRLTRGVDEAWIVWNPTRRTELTVPGAWKIRRVRELMGSERTVAAGNRVAIGPLPVLLER